MVMFLAMRLPLAGLVAVILSGVTAAGSAAEGVSPWVPIGISGTAAVGLVALFRKVQKDIIGEQDKRYDDLKLDLRAARRDALRARKRAEHAERLHANCEADARRLRHALATRGYLPAELDVDDTPDPVMPEPTDAELDVELGYDESDS